MVRRLTSYGKNRARNRGCVRGKTALDCQREDRLVTSAATTIKLSTAWPLLARRQSAKLAVLIFYGITERQLFKAQSGLSLP